MANSEFAAKENDAKTQSASPPQIGTSPIRPRKLAELYVRLAVGTAFLSAVADRFGLWGPYGHKNVDWGDFSHFVAYTARVNSFLPAAIIPAVHGSPPLQKPGSDCA